MIKFESFVARYELYQAGIITKGNKPKGHHSNKESRADSKCPPQATRVNRLLPSSSGVLTTSDKIDPANSSRNIGAKSSPR